MSYNEKHVYIKHPYELQRQGKAIKKLNYMLSMF